ncbi:hypothetical protein [Xanthocytophaga flava]|uniref:hypothetical protein n=1 Tax=Xanthocytophaga flava TaxID=3048013 RepID=UPI0028D66C42|nr:hypothetical protein [Xanthocytophaga flavus]MDJ1468650.1 hypothetical protein [Xanthocytophaga flavus]
MKASFIAFSFIYQLRCIEYEVAKSFANSLLPPKTKQYFAITKTRAIKFQKQNNIRYKPEELKKYTALSEQFRDEISIFGTFSIFHV